MKVNKSIRLLIISFITGFLISECVVEANENINFATNPSFEVDDDMDSIPDCWTLATNYPNYYYLDSNVYVFGTTSLKMETYCQPGGYKTSVGGGSQKFDINPNSTYTISYYIKTDRPDKVYARPGTWESDANNNPLGQHYTYITLAQTQDWQRVSYTFTTYPTAVKMWLTVAIHTVYDEPVEGVFYNTWIDGVQLEEAESATPFHISFNNCTGILPVAIEMDPNTLNLNSRGRWVTSFIELPDGYNADDIDIGSIFLNGSVPAEPKPVNVEDYDSDGVHELMVKFNRSDVQSTIEEGDLVQMSISGLLINGTLFKGNTTIRVISH